MYVSVPPGTKGKHIQCDVTSSGMTLKLRGQQAPLIKGEFERKYVVVYVGLPQQQTHAPVPQNESK